MQRVPEPELMDEDEQAIAYANADFREPHDAVIAELRKRLPDLAPSGHAIDLGCGPADISIRFALAYPRWTVDGLDGSEAMLRQGRDLVTRSLLGDRVRLVQCYLPHGEAPRNSYDLVLSTSLLHHLADPMDLWRSVERWGSSGTPVFVVDLKRPGSLERARELVDMYAAGEPEVLREDFLNSLCAAYRVEEVREQIREAGIRGVETEAVSDRHLTAWGYLS